MKWEYNEKSYYKKILDDDKQTERAAIHSFHRYFGKLIPSIPRAYIQEFTKEGDLVADLFSGSGTVAVESKLLNRNFIGCEINPLSSFISQVKTTTYDVKILEKINKEIELKLYDESYFSKIEKKSIPFCVNIDHWFKPNVIDDILLIESTINESVENSKISKKNKDIYKNFYYAVLSSVIRNISNADPQHVFPGISKKMRALEAEGRIHKDAKKTFINAIKKRTTYYKDYDDSLNSNIKIINDDSLTHNFNSYKEKVDLFVTNPPYISSVRYIETMKLEMYMLEFLKNQDDYSSLAKLMVGNDRVSKKEINYQLLTNYDEINQTILQLQKIDLKSAYIVAKYFNDMEIIIHNMYFMLKKHGKVVVKISESNVKKIKVDTGKFLTVIAEAHGFKLLDVFLDKINDNSRSLLTARNTYSNIILNDNIIIWEKKDEQI